MELVRIILKMRKSEQKRKRKAWFCRQGLGWSWTGVVTIEFGKNLPSSSFDLKVKYFGFKG
jgi:hypothetical protein